MKTLAVNGKEHTLLDKNDKCPICGTDRKKMRFIWNMFHGEATSDCCGAIYQIKDYYIENPTDEERELLEALRGDFIEFAIKEDWVEPLKQAILKTGIQDITNDTVMDEARSIRGE